MAAEIGRHAARVVRRLLASMRPRRMAAEIAPRGASWTGICCFNEAAANGRGNRGGHAQMALTSEASMRPRRMAAEIPRAPRRDPRFRLRFNEAAANGRGNPAARRRGWRKGCRFNEAAANGRGNPAQVDPVAPRGVAASMRPRRMAAEIGAGQLQARPASARASMRPRRMAAEILAAAERAGVLRDALQ